MNKLFKRILTVGASLVMAAAVAVPAMAEDTDPGTAAAPVTAAISVRKTVQAKVANEFPTGKVYKFTLERSSVLMGRTTGKQYTNTDMPLPDGTTGTTATVTVTVTADVTDTTNMTEVGTNAFADISYENTGIYTYELTEEPGDELNVGYDGAHYFVNVYVTNDLNTDGTPKFNEEGKLLLKVSHITLYKGENNGTMSWTEFDNPNDEGTGSVGPDATASSGKINITTDGTMEVPFVNHYPTEALVIKKTVTGNLGNPDEDFAFSINFANAPDDYNFAYKIMKDGVTGVITEGAFTDAGTDENVHTFKLKHNEHITIYGVPVGLEYRVSETAVEGYITKIDWQNGSNAVPKDHGTLGSDTSSVTTSGPHTIKTTTRTAEEEEAGVIRDNHEYFTNHKQSTPPTGVLLRVAPFALLAVLLVAGIAFVALNSNKRHKNGYQGL